MKEVVKVEKEATNWFSKKLQLFKRKLDLVRIVVNSEKLIIISYRDNIQEDGSIHGTKAICKVSGIDYSQAIYLTDHFITNEKVVLSKDLKLTFGSAIEMYGTTLRVVEDRSLKSSCIFDRVSCTVFMNSITHKNWITLKKSANVEQMMSFAYSINLQYAK